MRLYEKQRGVAISEVSEGPWAHYSASGESEVAGERQRSGTSETRKDEDEIRQTRARDLHLSTLPNLSGTQYGILCSEPAHPPPGSHRHPQSLSYHR